MNGDDLDGDKEDSLKHTKHSDFCAEEKDDAEFELNKAKAK